MIIYDIHKISAIDMLQKLQDLDKKSNLAKTQLLGKIHYIKVSYNFKDGLDLKDILFEKSITLQDFIATHTNKIYDIYSIGFLENFAYMGNLDKKICTPRHSTPRQKILKNSVGIADCQTGIYPQNSSAGWKIIGKTTNNLPVFKVGDRVQFIADTH